MSIQYADLRLTEVAAHIQIKKAMLELIDLVTVFDAILTSRQTREKLQ